MATLGIVGGIAPPSTIAYYRAALATYRERTGRALPILVNSVDTDAFFALLEAGDRPAIVASLVAEVDRLAAAGADLAIIASNTGHIGFDEIRAASPIPMVSIVDATAATLAGVPRVGLFATTFTIDADVYGSALARHGIDAVGPEREDQDRLQEIYFGELVNGVFLDESRRDLLAIAERLRDAADVGTILLAGTELPLLLTDVAHGGVRFVDTGRIHVEAAVDRVIALEPPAS